MSTALAFTYLNRQISLVEAKALLGNHRAQLPHSLAQPGFDSRRPPADHEGMVATRRERFDIFISRFVLDEAAAGDAEAARERLLALQNFPLLDLSDEVGDLATTLVSSLNLPPKAVTDAAHIAIAAVHGMHFLLTWNCTHIANAEMSVAIEDACRERGYTCPVICTPEELMGV